VAEASAAILGPPTRFSGSALPLASPEDLQAERAGATAARYAVLVSEAASLVQEIALVKIGHQVDHAGGSKALPLHVWSFSSSDLSMRLVVEAWPAIRAGDTPDQREANQSSHHCQQLHHRRSSGCNSLYASWRLPW
jgi:hypothetical protein